MLKLKLGDEVTLNLGGTKRNGVVIMVDLTVEGYGHKKYRCAYEMSGGWSRSGLLEDIRETWWEEIENGDVLFDENIVIDLPFHNTGTTWGGDASNITKGWDNV